MLAQVVLILALLLVLVGMIMVLLDAFNESFFWGILVLMLPPIFVPFYSFVKCNKSQARNGFAMALVGVFLAGVGVYGGGLQNKPLMSDNEIVCHIPNAAPKDEPLPNEEEAASVKLEDEDEESYDPILSTDKDRFTSKEIEPLAPEEDKTVKNIGKRKSTAVRVPIDNIGSAMGADIEITLNDGVKYVGTLVRSTEDSISIEQQASGGMVSYEYTLDKIQSVLRLTKPKKTVTPPVVKIKETETPPAIETKNTVIPPAVETEEAITPPTLETKDTVTPSVVETENTVIPPAVETEEAITPPALETEEAITPPVLETKETVTPPVVETEENVNPPVIESGEVQ